MLNIYKAEFEKSGTRPDHYPTDPLPEIAFVGKSNVGKSSLLNILANRKQLAHVSSTPGRTQLINFFRINDDKVRFVDLPGYGFAKAPKLVAGGWERMIISYLTTSTNLRALCALFDIRRTMTEEDEVLLRWLRHHDIPFIAVLTKADKLTRSQQSKARAEIQKTLSLYAPIDIVLFSSTNRQGRDELLELIEKIVEQPERAKQ